MGRPVLKPGGPAPIAAGRGFTLVEVMVAMTITIIAMLANLYLFNTARKNLAASKALTNATNFATAKIAEFRAKTIAEINAAAPTVQAAPNPLLVRQGSDVAYAADDVDHTLAFTRTWVVSAIDLEHTSPAVPELVGDLVKIRLDVTWTLAGKGHHVTMTTFVSEKTQ